MGPIVGDVDALDAELDRHGAVSDHGEDEEQPFEVGSVVIRTSDSRESCR